MKGCVPSPSRVKVSHRSTQAAQVFRICVHNSSYFLLLVILYLRPTFFHVTLPEASCLRFFRESSDWNEAETFVCHRGREMEAESAVHVTALSSSFGYLVDFPSFAVSLLGVNSYKLIHLYTVC